MVIIKRKGFIISLISIGLITAIVYRNQDSDAIDVIESDEREQLSIGIETIKNLEEKDVLEVEKEIDSVQSSLANNSVNSNNTSISIDYINKFSSSVIMGDSRAESISAYGILNNSSVIAKKGRNLIKATKEGDINTVANLSPQNIFLSYGMNDIGIYASGEDFVKQYEKFIKEIQSKLPNSKIYVNSIFRVSNAAQQKNSIYKKISSFNASLEKMCDKLGVTFIDGSSCVQDDLFDSDGVHFKPQFNKNWLNLLIEKANL